ncbi:hypothetical protein [Nannocystis pusilla]|uniref:Right handed beta helix domain-containing protein n=1 Tax=Nannocystis pusilla TaxID=889268 RepID=A0ABS7U716_9BACT|nr:hypothetical protein [Nannocystis pusilla]MBZ5716056.1 hypothetical protein [Nannocystis pusilla]
MRTLSVVLGAGALIGFGGGCFITNTSHCGFHQDGSNNPCPADMVCNVCAADNNGCVPKADADAIPMQCRDNGVTTTETQTQGTEPTAGPTSLPTEPTTTTETTTTTTAGPTTEPVDTTTETSTTEAPPTTMMATCDADVLDDPACGEQYCVAENQCGWCTSLPADKTCADVDEATPACDQQSGKCVQCTKDAPQACSGSTPVCDDETNTCVPCTEHSQCPNSACDIQEGECFPEEPEFIFYVQGSLSDCQNKDGKSAQTAFCALADVQLNETKTTIRLLPGATSPLSLTVPDGKAVALVREGMQPPEINGEAIGGPTLVVSPGARLYVSGIKLRFSTPTGYMVRCAAGSFYAHDTTWEGNGMHGSKALEASSCKTFIHRSRIVRCGAGIQASSGELLVENSFIMQNGVGGFSAFNLLNDVKARITYSTIGLNKVINGVSTFACMGSGQNIVVRNSAVVGLAPLTSCKEEMGQTLVFENGTKEEVPDLATANNLMSQWFNPPQLDVYTPKNDGPLEGMAMWEQGDPKFDFFLAAIPTDEPSFAGARQPP